MECFTTPGTTLRALGDTSRCPDRSNLPSGVAGDDFLHRFDQLGGGQQSVTAFGHGRGSGMIGEAVNLDLVLVNADYAFDHSDWDAGFIESATLLDVQLQIAMDGAGGHSRFSQLCRIAANLAQVIGQRDAVVHLRQVRGLQVAGCGTAAHRQGFLVRPDGDLKRMPGGDVMFLQGAHDFDGGHGTHVAVEVAAAGDGIDMRAEENRLQRTVAALAPAQDVSGGINSRLGPAARIISMAYFRPAMSASE